MSTFDELYQDKVWTQRGGVTLKLKQMGPSHRRNLLALIERHGAKLHRKEINGLYRFSMILNGEMALDAVDSEINVLEDMSPQEYVDRLPLVIKLRKMVAKDTRRPLAERERMDEEARRLADKARLDRTVASFDDPDSEPPRPTKQYTPAEDAAFDREWGSGFPRPHPASLDDGWRMVSPG